MKLSKLQLQAAYVCFFAFQLHGRSILHCKLNTTVNNSTKLIVQLTYTILDELGNMPLALASSMAINTEAISVLLKLVLLRYPMTTLLPQPISYPITNRPTITATHAFTVLMTYERYFLSVSNWLL